jgi:hypothetical protein
MRGPLPLLKVELCHVYSRLKALSYLSKENIPVTAHITALEPLTPSSRPTAAAIANKSGIRLAEPRGGA